MGRSRANDSSKPSARSRRSAASYQGLSPASARASATARATSRKRDTSCEVALRKALWARGLRYRIASETMIGHPDLVFAKVKVVVFCDGDFWHGRNLDARLAKLQRGHNAPYWVAKISGNVARDARVTADLQAAGWTVVRCWEGDIRTDLETVVDRVIDAVASKAGAVEPPSDSK